MEAYTVVSFKEKPAIETAKTYIESGKYLWNAGIFFFRLGSMLEKYKTYLPEMYAILDDIRTGIRAGNGKETIEKLYPQMAATSIDYGIIEKISERIVVPMRKL